MASQFVFTISTDIIAAKADDARLDEEIRQSSITVALDGVSIAGDTLTIDFKTDLSAGEETALHGDATGPAGGLVGNHSGEPLPDPATADGIPKVHIDAPEEVDGKLLVTPTPSPGKGWKTYYSSNGDHATNGRGKGAQFRLSLAGADSGQADITFNEPVWLHDGELSWYDAADTNSTSVWTHDDWFSVSTILPATTPVSNPGAGNCNLVPVGGGNIIVPAAGNGSHDIDLATAVPVPSQDETGYYDADLTSGAVTISATPGAAKFNLFDFAIETFFVPGWSMGAKMGIFAIDAYQSEWVSERWTLRLHVEKTSAGAGEVGGGVMVYRRNTTTF
jgi:hypothetical protein